MSEPVLKLEKVWKIYQLGKVELAALRNVELEIVPGGFVSIMGPSGSGKSTLLNIVGLLDRPTKGTYRLEDVGTTELSNEQQALVRRDKIGFVFQFFHLIPRLSAAENVELPLTLGGVDTTERKTRVSDALAAMGLTDRARHRPDQLSGGQRQRVAIARATIMNPSVILADEPTGNLDRSSGKEVIQILEGLNRQGVTLVVVTHDPALGNRADRIIQIVDGVIVKDDK